MTVNDVDLQVFIDSVWTDAPLMAGLVSITRGTDPYGNWPRPARFECELDNDTLSYDPSNPTSVLYGVAGRNTPVRVMPSGTSRLVAEASEWSPERSMEHQPGARRGRSTTNLVAEGMLRRLGKWTDPLRSPMYRTISTRSTSIGHWSLEEPSGATLIANSRDGGPALDAAGQYSLGDGESPYGAASSLKMSATTSLSGKFTNASATAGWQISFSYRLPAVPSSVSYGNLMRWRTSNGYTWLVQINNGGYRFVVLDDDDVSLTSTTSTFGTGREPNQWITMRIKASASGGTVTMEPAWYAQGDTNEVGVSPSFSGTVGALRTWNTDPGVWTDGSWYSHVFGVTGLTDNLVGSTAQKVFNGYLGETTGQRFLRLTAELGITRFISGASADSTPMGPQRPNTFLNLLAEIRETEDGRIDDNRGQLALNMTTRRFTYNLASTLDLTYPQHISPPFRRVLDDAATRNRVTVSNALGGDFTAARTTGAMSVQPPPAGVGEYKHTVDVSVADPEAQLENLATHHLAKGTLERPRYESVTVDLVANPGLKTACFALSTGAHITVTGAEPDVLHFYVTGVQERIQPGTWTMTFQVEPWDIWDIGIWDDASFRWDAKYSTLNAAATDTATSLTFTTPDLRDVWSTSFTGELMVAGERIKVTTMGAVTGSGPYTQTATVQRSQNGIVKAQKAGSEVHLAVAKRWGL